MDMYLVFSDLMENEAITKFMQRHTVTEEAKYRILKTSNMHGLAMKLQELFYIVT
jgi:hypothetical protein